ncbi:DNA-directed RNA polymerase subunit L [Candidatus Woesearchaeota archaeon]|nr:DNA-directed RNA polymerase subunit L [Candidatus Woesearchaeota archaeon]
MKLTIIENKAQKLVFELEGADHTLCNILKDELKNNDSVSVSTYTISHPLVGKPKFFLETKKGEKPVDALKKAIDNIKKQNATMQKAFKTMK